MGQQQLLLIILVTVLVGIITIVAINTMQASRKEANKDAVRLDLLKAVPRAQAYYKRAKSMDGGGGSFKTIGFRDLVLDTSNVNGLYSIRGRNNDSFKLVGTPVSTGEEMVLVVYSNRVEWE